MLVTLLIQNLIFWHHNDFFADSHRQKHPLEIDTDKDISRRKTHSTSNQPHTPPYPDFRITEHLTKRNRTWSPGHPVGVGLKGYVCPYVLAWCKTPIGYFLLW
ncbi:hypothetical protein JTE90_007114 [Oedothorax gibbosus]|uniref:Uncharacterized protein n=1 Tax=Oedothorax gibbosus TaxID=931172 RepID=A0AAV6VQ91_9ARAC|nr:hypothetical protein JTE90_007114 [Oedothorax gibbosus]